MLTDAELAAVRDWRFAKQMPSVASAIRELLRRGLTAEGFTLFAVWTVGGLVTRCSKEAKKKSANESAYDEISSDRLRRVAASASP